MMFPSLYVPITGPLGMDALFDRIMLNCDIPLSHNRKRAEFLNREYIKAIQFYAVGMDDVKEGDTIYYMSRYNMGTKRYPYVITALEYDTVTKINAKTVECGRYFKTRVHVDKILAIQKRP